MSRSGNQTRARLIDFIARYIDEHGYSPSQDEMRKELALSSRSHVSYHLRVLRAEGRVDWEPRRTRTVRLVEQVPA